ncbi:right-handed parallel beta-helix repeat-containing protein [Candidatus Dojkabacteria bacterium]|nr:right-handed parallel beta-helix repeat-containing protein [Candidatus Dojkabacteria bacterium]
MRKLLSQIFPSVFIFSLFLIIPLFFPQNTKAYDQLGEGVCECNSCSDCTSALEDDTNCTTTVRLTVDILDEQARCIDHPAGNDKTFDCQNHTIDGTDNDIGIGISGTSGGNNITIQNCFVNDFQEGIVVYDGSTYVITSNTVSSCLFGIGAYRNSNVTISGNTANLNDYFGIHTIENTLASITGNTVTNTTAELGPASYYISQYSNGSWKGIAVEHFTTQYKTKSFLAHEDSNELKLRFVQKNIDFGDIESIQLYACGTFISPKYARYLDTGESVLEDILYNDLNVVVAHEKEVEIAWDIPLMCSYPYIVSLNANEYGQGLPIQSPHSRDSEFYTYEIDSSQHSINTDGVLNENDKLNIPQFISMWEPTSGHPKGNTFVYISNDNKNVYISFDITSDNTNEYGQDWIEIETSDTKVFRIDDFNDKYGKCGFGTTDKVAFKHQMCEFAIPKEEFHNSDISFKVRYYGTGSAGGAGTGIIVESDNATINNNVVTDNATYGIFIDNSLGNTITLNTNTVCNNYDTDIIGTNMDPTITGDNNKCDTTFDWNDAGTTGCTFGCDDTPPVFVQLPGSTELINITEGQVITVNPYTIKVKPEDDESGINKVEIYIDDVLICTITTPDANGVYSCNWDTSKYHSTVRAVAYNNNNLTAQITRTANVALSETGQNILLGLVFGLLLVIGTILTNRIIHQKKLL